MGSNIVDISKERRATSEEMAAVQSMQVAINRTIDTLNDCDLSAGDALRVLLQLLVHTAISNDVPIGAVSSAMKAAHAFMVKDPYPSSGLN
jgi:hypothetical protein